ncbi:ribonuclease HII [Ferroplasma acidarmanus]|uniref:Ribonuclease HII n=1 Tax=Ferroplasma acidarmanus Fer1 TaxID=333146 RepID=S0ANV8_FERAC|nr:ribonuclease HII [Ferroplasma acidarmanus]AGO60596.1 ribonuclease HII [Ferroplasma acidarmanus Fer1]
MDECGIDEAGRGPLIGPMVMAILCGDRESLEIIGVADSKKLSPGRRESLFARLQSYKYNFVIISPSEIDRYVEHQKLNVLEETYASKLASWAPASSTVYVDSFDVNELRLQSLLMENTKRQIVCRHKADEIYPCVSAASIIAKVIRDREIDKLHKDYGDFGSGYPSDPRTINFVKNALKNGINIDSIVRHQWKTYKSMLNKKLTY